MSKIQAVLLIGDLPLRILLEPQGEPFWSELLAAYQQMGRAKSADATLALAHKVASIVTVAPTANPPRLALLKTGADIVEAYRLEEGLSVLRQLVHLASSVTVDDILAHAPPLASPTEGPVH